VRLCHERIDADGHTSTQVYSDHAISGATLLRPGIQALMEDASRGKFDVVYAEALDRISRDQEDAAGDPGVHQASRPRACEPSSTLDGGVNLPRGEVGVSGSGADRRRHAFIGSLAASRHHWRRGPQGGRVHRLHLLHDIGDGSRLPSPLVATLLGRELLDGCPFASSVRVYEAVAM